MSHLKIKTEIEILDNSGSVKKIKTSKTATSLSDIKIFEITIGANETVSVWDTQNNDGDTDTLRETVDNFDYLIMVANGTLDVELVIDDGNEVGEELNSFRLVKDVPFILGADDAYANHSTGNIYGGTLDVIEQIRVDEPSNTAVKLTMILVT